MSDKAIVTRLTVLPLEGAKTLALGKCMGYTILVGKETSSGELGLLFEDGLQLSQEFSEKNNLVRKKDADGKNVGGYFEENRRVRAKKFMGVKSEAFWCPISYLEFTGYKLDKLKEGDLIETLNGVPICNKYITKATANRKNGPSRRELRGQIRTFPKHQDTEQFRHYVDKIPNGARIILTEKVHGTSQRVGYVLDEIPLKWYHSLLMKLGFPIRTHEYKFMIGTRNVICEGKDGFYSHEFRKLAAKPFENKLHKGEVVYCEVVGYEPSFQYGKQVGSRPIMGSVSTISLKDKEVQKKYGDTIVYNYGLPEGEFDIYVYRICWINEDGVRFELPWEHVKARCIELGVKHVKEHPVEIFHCWLKEDIDGQERAIQLLSEGVNALAENHSNGYTHPNEGVVLRWEHKDKMGLYKHKSFLFKLLEGIIKEDENFVDEEEAS